MGRQVAWGAAWLGLFAAILLAWWAMFAMARMSGVDWIGRPVGLSMMPMAGFGPLLAMWALMMGAMMLLVMVPTLAAYETLMRRAGAGAVGATRAGWFGVLVGYLGAWLGMAALLAGTQAWLLAAGAVDALGRARSLWLTAALLLAAGAWQLSPVKAACQGVCLAPVPYFLGCWRGGAAGGARMGAGLGGFCAACCWGYMALGFVGGTMSLVWMGAATGLMVLEKLPQIGHHVTRPVGALMLAAAAAAGARALGWA